MSQPTESVYHGGMNHPEMVTDEFLTCRICNVPGFRDPRKLSCGHTFCLCCLESGVGGAAVVGCPVCGKATKMPPGGAAALPLNLFASTQIDRLLRRHNYARGRDDTLYNIPYYQGCNFSFLRLRHIHGSYSAQIKMKQGHAKQREHTIPLTGYGFNGDKEIYYPPGGATISIQRQKMSNKLKITLCSICILITVGIIGLAFLLFLKVQSNTNTARSEFCLPCDRLNSKTVPTGAGKGAGSLSVRLVERSGTKVQLCCGKEELFNHLLDNFLTEERKHNPSDPSVVRGPPSDSVMAKFPVAHLTLNKKYDVRADTDSLFSVHGWTLQKSRFAIKQCPYQRGRLIITQPGLYYVYSQVHFIEKPSEDSSTYRAQSLSHYIFKYNRYLSNGGYRSVLQSSASRCKSETGSVEQSSYLGAVLRLYKNDQMFVKVNNLTSLHPEARSTYFGLYYISPLPKS